MSHNNRIASLVFGMLIVAVGFQNCTKTDIGFNEKQVLNQSLVGASNNGTGYTGKISFVERVQNGLCSASSNIVKQIDVQVVNMVAKQAQLVIENCTPVPPVDLQLDVDIKVAPDLSSAEYKSVPLTAEPVYQGNANCTGDGMTLTVKRTDRTRSSAFLKTPTYSYDLTGSYDGQSWIFIPLSPQPSPEAPILQLESGDLSGVVLYFNKLPNVDIPMSGNLTCTGFIQ